ncbi:cysteinyl-tRNA synthetase, partial [Coemansia helicoidea]
HIPGAEAAAGSEDSRTASQLSDNQLHAALRRTFLTLNKDLGTNNRQLMAAAAAAETFAARTARPSATSTMGSADSHGPAAATHRAAGQGQGGATAVVAYIQGRTLHVANAGDALGVVSRRGTPMVLSTRHDPYDPSEVRRIRSIGGYITQQGKVQGQTDITRAFGYFHLLPYVNADPTINSLQLTEEDEFLIMANRPVWDAITPQIAVDIARKHRRDPRQAAARVRDHVLAYGATKSVMVMVVGFGPMFAKNTGRPMRGFSVRDSMYPGVPDHRARYAMSRRMSRSPSSVLPPPLAPRPSVSHPIPADGRASTSGTHPIVTGAHAGALASAHMSPYDAIDEFDEFLSLSRTRRQRDRDVNARPGDSTLARLEREVPPPIGEVVLVFTDVKNSTAQWETSPVAMRSAIKVHNGIMRRMLRSIGGYEVKTEGDAFMVSFPTVASALHWCLAVQVTFLTAEWPEEILDSEHGCPIYWPTEEGRQGDGAPRRTSTDEGHRLIYRGLRVRMGMHLGNPVSEEDPITRRMDYFGPMVNRAARISGAADGGQVYVSQDVMDEVLAILGLFDTADHSAIADMRQIIDEPSLARDVQALRNLGLSAVQVGEIKLKGLESPEFVSHVYPAALRGRIDMQAVEAEQLKQQKQQQKQKRRRQDWALRDSPAAGSSRLAKQRGDKASKSTESLTQSMASEHGGQRSSLDEGSLQACSEAPSPRALSALSSPRGSINKKPPPPPPPPPAPGQQRIARELSLDMATGSPVPCPVPISRRSISMVHNYAGRFDQLGSIGEDGSSAASYMSGRAPRAPVGFAGPPGMRLPLYMPPPYYPHAPGSFGDLQVWHRQGSSAHQSGQAMSGGHSWLMPWPKSRQQSRGSVDTAMAIRGASSAYGASASASARTSFDLGAIDPVQLDTLFRLIYRLQILAVEPNSSVVRPSFEYFVARQADSLASYRVQHDSAASSVPDRPLPPLPKDPVPTAAPNRAGDADPESRRSSPSSIDEVLHSVDDSELSDAARARGPLLSTYQMVPSGPAAATPQLRSVSPALAQPIPIHASQLHRHSHSASPAPRWGSASTTRI